MPDRYERQRENREGGSARRRSDASREGGDAVYRRERTASRSQGYSRAGRSEARPSGQTGRARASVPADDARYRRRGTGRSAAPQASGRSRARGPAAGYGREGGQRPRNTRGQAPRDSRYPAQRSGQRQAPRPAQSPRQVAPSRSGRGQGRGSYDAFDPRANMQDGRTMRIANRPQPQYSFDIADAFQLGKYILAGVVALLVVIFVVRAVYMASPATYTVQGQEVQLARSTTYQALLDQGAFDVHPGNLVAVDDEVLEEGAGKQPTVYLDGQPVELGALVSDQGDITAENGEDEIEPYQATQEITPITTQIARDKEAEAEGAEEGKFNFYNGVLHVVTDQGQEGITETRTGETSGKTATVKVQEMKPRLFENLHSVLPESKKYIALTFDDGPVPGESNTSGILNVLAKYNVKGTFFMLGTQVEENPELAKQVAAGGHQVASHLYSHSEKLFLNAVSEDQAREQVAKAREVISQLVGVEATYVRPTGGNVDVKAIKAAGEAADGYIGWTLDTFDYNLPGSDAIVTTIVDGAEPGAVVLMHDGGGDRSQTAAALDKAIPQLQAKGYTFVTVEELVAAVLEERGSTGDGANS